MRIKTMSRTMYGGPRNGQKWLVDLAPGDYLHVPSNRGYGVELTYRAVNQALYFCYNRARDNG